MQDIEMITSEITLLLPHHPNYLSEYVSKIKQKKKKLKKSAGKKIIDDYLLFLSLRKYNRLKIVFQL